MHKILLTVLLVFFLTACNEESSPTADVPVDEIKIQQSLDVLDAFGQPATVFNQGETITFVLNAVNTSNDMAKLGFGSGRQFDFYVRRADDLNSLLWDPWPEKLFTQAETAIELQPLETKSFSQSWNQVQLDGSMLPAGNYMVEATFYNAFPESEFVEFQVN